MDSFDQLRFIEEIKFQSRLAYRAIEDYNRCYKIWESQPFDEHQRPVIMFGPPSEERDRIVWATYDIFRHLHSFLAHVGNISKLFWPIGTKRANETDEQFEVRKPAIKRGRELREIYNVDAINMLSNRVLRDHFEHFDERMDTYFKQYRGSIINNVIGCDELLTEPGRDSILRHATYNCFSFRGDDFDLKLLIDAVTQIMSRSTEIRPD